MHILIAEDNEAFRNSLGRALKREGHEVLAVENGQDLLDALNAKGLAGESFGLVLTDVQMPEMSGLEALRHLREDARFTSQKVVVMSADSCYQQEAEGFGAAFIGKMNLVDTKFGATYSARLGIE